MTNRTHPDDRNPFGGRDHPFPDLVDLIRRALVALGDDKLYASQGLLELSAVLAAVADAAAVSAW